MYADDTTLFCDINSIPDVEHSLNAELNKITDWLAANKLSLNANKTMFMVFHSDKNQFDILNYISMLLKQSVRIILTFLVYSKIII